MALEDIYIHPSDVLLNKATSAIRGHELPPGYSRDDLCAILEAASEAFWAVIADRFPEVKTGDFGPEEHCAWEGAMEDAVCTWLMWNHPAGDPWETKRKGRAMAEAMGHDWSTMSEKQRNVWAEEAWAEMNARAVS